MACSDRGPSPTIVASRPRRLTEINRALSPEEVESPESAPTFPGVFRGLNMSTHSFDTTAARFEQDVLERSKTVPVLVDFWAPWCAPCRVLKPILEKLAVEFEGRFALAKVNTDENPEIATRYGVRGIPNVKAFVDGQLVDEFTGALPESGVRGFLEGLIPSQSEKLRRAAAAALAKGDAPNAEAALREAIALDPANLDARIDFAALLLARDDYAGAEAQLAEVPDDLRDDRA